MYDEFYTHIDTFHDYLIPTNHVLALLGAGLSAPSHFQHTVKLAVSDAVMLPCSLLHLAYFRARSRSH